MSESQNSCKLLFGNNLTGSHIISTANYSLQVCHNIYGAFPALVVMNIQKLGACRWVLKEFKWHEDIALHVNLLCSPSALRFPGPSASSKHSWKWLRKRNHYLNLFNIQERLYVNLSIKWVCLWKIKIDITWSIVFSSSYRKWIAGRDHKETTAAPRRTPQGWALTGHPAARHGLIPASEKTALDTTSLPCNTFSSGNAVAEGYDWSFCHPVYL